MDDATWNGRIEYVQTNTTTASLLSLGSNNLAVETVGDTGAAVDALYANWLEIEYQALYASQDDVLLFGAPGEDDYRFEVTGFGSGDVEAFDIRDPAAPVRQS